MKLGRWFLLLSNKQRIWILSTLVIMVVIVALGILVDSGKKTNISVRVGVDMPIRKIAPMLGVTPKALARELKLPLNVSKRRPLSSLRVTDIELQQVVQHLLSHRDSTLKYYIYLALVLWGLVFLVKVGRPSDSNIRSRKKWYPQTPYVISLLLSVIIAGFFLGKSPNPMEGIVKVFKSMAGLYPDPYAKLLAFIFFLSLATIGNKLICGWACPMGALQELIYSFSILKKIKRIKIPFVVTNSIRVSLFIMMLLLLFGSIGKRKGVVLYHYLNPFNLFDLDLANFSILLTVIIVLGVSFIVYRPFCQIVCPFGLVSWLVERWSLYKVIVDKEKCTEGGICIAVCPLDAMKDRLAEKKMPADCFSCARCLNVCPVDAIKYKLSIT